MSTEAQPTGPQQKYEWNRESWRNDSVMPEGKTLGMESELHGMAMAMGHPGRYHTNPIFSTQA